MEDFLIIKIDPENREEAHQYITKCLKGFNSEYPINLKYHDEELYGQKEAKSFITGISLTKLFFYLTIIASLVGLFGLSLFIAERNIKEVGIRKVCGSSISSLIIRLLKNLMIQVLIAICIATPLVSFIAKGYTSFTPYKFPHRPLFYFSGGGIAIILMVLTVGFQIYRAAKRNPIEALRYE